MPLPAPFRLAAPLFRRRFIPAVTAILVAPLLHGQTSSNTCTNAAANRYPVNGTCVPIAFNKPSTYTATYNPGGCNAGNYNDAWGSFIATGGVTTVQYTPTGGTNAILHVLATCTGPVLGCSDVAGNNGTEAVTIETVPGTTYYVRVQRKGSNSAMNGNLCIYTVGDCIYTLHLFDSFGDGWTGYGGNAYVAVVVNGTTIGNYTLNNGYEGYVNMPLYNGDVLGLTYNINGHTYYMENSFTVRANGGDCLYFSDAPPTAQTVTIHVTCPAIPPPAAPQDCIGGVTVCSDQSISSNSTGFGCAMDLNASNRGCLLNNERQGSWYYFSPSASGTLGFTLIPHNPTDDYDFALWGPYDAVQCPTGAPARCSYYDGTFYNNTTTGMGNGANDTSEGAYAPPASNNGWVKTMDVVAGKVYVLYIDNWSSTGQAFDLDWNLTNGASLNCITLPVELLALEANARNRVVNVDWSTATERNAAWFEVQRSADNINFAAIGTVPAAGNTLWQTDYRFTDESPLKGANYYRLRQVDRDGAQEYTHSVVAFLDMVPGQPPLLFPNPARQQLQVAFSSNSEGTGRLEAQDALGRTMLAKPVHMTRGSHTENLSLDLLPAGWYSLRVLLPDGTPLPATTFLKQ
ncbi:MAG TPA: hypothetical protein PKD45_01415 [Flavobacteriales bacterium]|nr:hypothetical protein [Flavobacteriales bacterium]